MKIIPGILTNNKSLFNKLMSEAESISERIHVDFVDGEFADNMTLEPIEIEVTRYLGDFDAHLMVASHNLNDWIAEVVESGFERIIVQVESIVGQADLIRDIKRKGRSVGLSLNLNTPLSKINEDVYSQLDVLLLMSVEAGYDGQNFDDKALEKATKALDYRNKNKHNFKICIDGGVTIDNIRRIFDAGVDEVVVGKRIFTPDLESNLEALSNKMA